jgi:Cu/Ag efflux pump CusA
LSIRQVAETVETAFSGMAVSRVQQGQATYDLTVRFDPAAKANIDAIRATLVTTASGARCRSRPWPTSAMTGRRTTSRARTCSARWWSWPTSPGATWRAWWTTSGARSAAQVQAAGGLSRRVRRPVRERRGSRRASCCSWAGVIVGIFLLLFVAFRTARDALLVMLNLPLAIIGGVVGVFVSGGVLSVASIIGFITLFGIATRNGVMMIAHIHHLVEHEGVRDAAEAVKRGAEERLVPILMTALAAGLALVPLALAAGQPGSEIQSPMAVVILFGLASSTLLNMLVVPALYLRFGAPRGYCSLSGLAEQAQARLRCCSTSKPC